jgi:hypothetical protein
MDSPTNDEEYERQLRAYRKLITMWGLWLASQGRKRNCKMILWIPVAV